MIDDSKMRGARAPRKGGEGADDLVGPPPTREALIGMKRAFLKSGNRDAARIVAALSRSLHARDCDPGRLADLAAACERVMFKPPPHRKRNPATALRSQLTKTSRELEAPEVEAAIALKSIRNMLVADRDGVPLLKTASVQDALDLCRGRVDRASVVDACFKACGFERIDKLRNHEVKSKGREIRRRKDARRSAQ